MKSLGIRWLVNFLGVFAVAAVCRGLVLSGGSLRCFLGVASLAGLNACVRLGAFTFGIGRIHALQRSLSLGALDLLALVVTTLALNAVAVPVLGVVLGGFRLAGAAAGAAAILLLSAVSLCASLVA